MLSRSKPQCLNIDLSHDGISSVIVAIFDCTYYFEANIDMEENLTFENEMVLCNYVHNDLTKYSLCTLFPNTLIPVLNCNKFSSL